MGARVPGNRHVRSTTVYRRNQSFGLQSIREIAPDLTLGPLNVLVGANGAGKSNLLSLFSLLPATLAGQLDTYVARHAARTPCCIFGAKQTSEIASL